MPKVADGWPELRWAMLRGEQDESGLRRRADLGRVLGPDWAGYQAEAWYSREPADETADEVIRLRQVRIRCPRGALVTRNDDGVAVDLPRFLSLDDKGASSSAKERAVKHEVRLALRLVHGRMDDGAGRPKGPGKSTTTKQKLPSSETLLMTEPALVEAYRHRTGSTDPLTPADLASLHGMSATTYRRRRGLRLVGR